MILDGRTRTGAEGEILAAINGAEDGKFGTTIFWITAHRKRAAAATRLIERGVIDADNSHGYPTIIFSLRERPKLIYGPQ